MTVSPQISFADAQIIYRNFAGKEGPYNKEGDRNFAVILNPEMEQRLVQEGWNVKYPKPREDSQEEDDRRPYLPITVSFKNFPPKVALIAGESTKLLEESELEMLDWAEIAHVDLVVRPYEWTMNGKSGVKAYLKAIYVTIVTDEFTDKYGI
jgi:hypothetical protein